MVVQLKCGQSLIRRVTGKHPTGASDKHVSDVGHAAVHLAASSSDADRNADVDVEV